MQRVLHLKGCIFSLFISITNISSRSLRHTIVVHLLQFLQLKPQITIFQEQSVTNEPEEMKTTDIHQVLQAILETKENRSNLYVTVLHPNLQAITMKQLLLRIRQTTTPSLSTRQTSPQPQPHHHQQNPQTSHPLITATTSTTYSPQHIPTTHHEPSTTSFTSLVLAMQELQKLIQHFNKSSSHKNSFQISFAKVLELSLNMEIAPFISSPPS
jgi:hypothetical protein